MVVSVAPVRRLRQARLEAGDVGDAAWAVVARRDGDGLVAAAAPCRTEGEGAWVPAAVLAALGADGGRPAWVLPMA